MVNTKNYTLVLWVLLSLFCFRVFAQLYQLVFYTHHLPPFEDWYSGALAYPYLLLSQILIIGIYLYICLQFSKGTVNPSKQVGTLFLSIGIIYACFMMGRLLIGQLISNSEWFHAYIPIFFHFILASFLIVVGVFHFRSFQNND